MTKHAPGFRLAFKAPSAVRSAMPWQIGQGALLTTVLGLAHPRQKPMCSAVEDCRFMPCSSRRCSPAYLLKVASMANDADSVPADCLPFRPLAFRRSCPGLSHLSKLLVLLRTDEHIILSVSNKPQ